MGRKPKPHSTILVAKSLTGSKRPTPHTSPKRKYEARQGELEARSAEPREQFKTGKPR